jgi:hypothetical protein
MSRASVLLESLKWQDSKGSIHSPQSYTSRVKFPKGQVSIEVSHPLKSDSYLVVTLSYNKKVMSKKIQTGNFDLAKKEVESDLNSVNGKFDNLFTKGYKSE